MAEINGNGTKLKPSATSMFCRISSPLILLLKRNVFGLEMSAHYSKQVKSNRYDRFLGRLDGESESEATERLNSDFEQDIFTNLEKIDGLKEAVSKEERKYRMVKYKTIERKHFRQSQELNLLTWDAKEQIRYLHLEFPEEWSIERLAESFPISKDGIIKLLRSVYQPKSLKELIRHDRQIQKNWVALTSGKEKEGPVALRYERLLSDGKLKTLQFAAGNIALPMPNRKLIESDSPEINTTGLFASIVKDYVQQKEQKLEQKLSNRLSLESHQGENIKHLSKATGIPEHRLLPSGQKNSMSKKMGYAKMFKYRDENMSTEEELIIRSKQSRNKMAAMERMIDFNLRKNKVGDLNEENNIDYNAKGIKISDNSSNMNSNNEPVQPRKSLRQRKSVTFLRRQDIDDKSHGKGSLENLDKLEKYTEQNISDLQKQNVKILSSHESETRKRPEDDILDKIDYDYPTRMGKTFSKKEAYIYDPKVGYQHPMGKVDPTIQDLDLSREVKLKSEDNSNKLYKKGNNYYDVDGEFLFRVP